MLIARRITRCVIALTRDVRGMAFAASALRITEVTASFRLATLIKMPRRHTTGLLKIILETGGAYELGIVWTDRSSYNYIFVCIQGCEVHA